MMKSGKIWTSGQATIFACVIPAAFIAGCASNVNLLIDAMDQTLKHPEAAIVANNPQNAHGFPCHEDKAIRGKVVGGNPNGPWPWGRTVIYDGVAPARIDIAHCGNVSGTGNVPFMLVVYGKRKSSWGEPPIILKVVLQNSAIAPFVPRQLASGYRIEAWGISANLTGDYAYFLDSVPIDPTDR